MNSTKIIVIGLIVLFAFGGLGMMSFGNKNKKPIQGNAIQQQGETQAEMMARMHPDRQQSSNSMAGHHSKSSKSPASDVSNTGMDTISFSESVGEQAPDFTLTKQDGSTFTLSDYKDKTVVLFFSGGAMCYPACWDQIEEIDADKRFNNDEVATVSIVVDAKEKWDKIISSQPKFGVGTILFDTDKTVSEAYSMLYAPSSMHKGSFPGHTYVVIKDGIISYVLDDPKMAINTDKVALEL